MIYTLTFNPAVDYVMHFDSLKAGEVNRSVAEELFFGGKGINVSVMLGRLGIASTAMGFVAGFTGAALEKSVCDEGVLCDFITVEGFTRINVKLHATVETELNGQGPKISENDISLLLKKISRLGSGDTLVLSGSIPKGVSDDIYKRILTAVDGKGVFAVVDATGDLLLNTLPFHPFLIKPNNFELGSFFGEIPKNENDIIAYAKRLQESGAQNILVSMAGDGAILFDMNGKVHKIGVPHGRLVNSVGAGDSMVAGFLAGFTETRDFDYALRLGTAAGSATAFSSGLGDREYILQLLKTI